VEPGAAVTVSGCCCAALAVFAGALRSTPSSERVTARGAERKRMLDLPGSLVDQSLVIAEERGSGIRSRNGDRA
jgi:hypothetical protein